MLAASTQHSTAKVVTADPIVATVFSKFNAYIVGEDGASRTCPNGYDLYASVLPKVGQIPQIYQFVVPPQMFFPKSKEEIIILCVQIKR